MADSLKAALVKALAEHGVGLSDEELAKVLKAIKGKN